MSLLDSLIKRGWWSSTEPSAEDVGISKQDLRVMRSGQSIIKQGSGGEFLKLSLPDGGIDVEDVLIERLPVAPERL